MGIFEMQMEFRKALWYNNPDHGDDYARKKMDGGDTVKKWVAVFLAVVLLVSFSGCGLNRKTVYESTYLTLFDTVTVIKGSAENEAAFAEIAQGIHDELEHYHQLFDIYHDYDGLNNLKTINDMAGIAPVKVEQPILDLLTDCKNYYELTGGRVNVAMGSVLRLWHEARNEALDNPEHARLPDMEVLRAATEHTDFDCIVVDEAASTVYITDPAVQLDVGAVAKGWAAQRAAEKAPANMLLSLGGNVCATGPKAEDTPWVIGVQNPAGANMDYLHTLNVTGGSYVTSGDYQRVYTVDGKEYHHIIDPDTLMPSEYWRSVTVVCDDSGLADALSTALFLLPLEEGQLLLEECGAMAMWVDSGGNMFYSPGFEALICS